MGTAADSEMTIGNASKKDLQDFGLEPNKPPGAPTLTDDAVRRARAAELMKLLAGGSRRATFLGAGEGGMGTGWKGTSSPKKTALGGY